MLTPTEAHIGEERMVMEQHVSGVIQQSQEHNQARCMHEIL